MSAHAIYSPSACYRNLSCVGSLAMIKKSGLKSKPSAYAEEGTLAHDWINKALVSIHSMKHFDFDQIEATEMREHVKNYCSFIGQLNTQFRKVHKGVTYYIENKVIYDKDFWGTVDYALCGFHKETGEPVCLICDFKYGKGVEVDAEENEQLICYAICLQNTLDAICETTHFFVYQPRTPGKEFTRWSVKKEHLVPAAHQIVKNKERCLSILKLYEEEGKLSDQNLCAGEWCRFCPAKNACPAYLSDINSTQLKILDEVPEIPAIEVLTLEQKVEVFKRRKTIKKFIDDICSDLLEAANTGGVPGFKIVEGQRRRCWPKDVHYVGHQLMARGIENPYKQSLIGIGEVEKQIGKGLIDDLTEFSKTSYQLVPEDDKRQAIQQIGLEDLGEIEL